MGIDFVAAAVSGAAALFVGAHGLSPVRVPDAIYVSVLPVAWVLLAAASKGYERRFVGVGNAEFERVFRAFIHVALASACASFLLKIPFSREVVVVALALALFSDLAGRCVARKMLHRRRRRGESMTSVIAVGGISSLAAFATLLRRDRHAGMRVIGVCVPADGHRDRAAERELDGLGIPVLGDIDSIVGAVQTTDAHTVAVLSHEISPEKLRWISWQLERTETSVVVSPGLTEIAGHRLHVQPVAGLPLLHIEKPTIDGFRHVVKGLFDRSAAALALLLLLPAMLGIALAVRLTSAGPAFFVQTRIGRDGREFRMFKFRSMVADAEARLPHLLERNEQDGVLFKIRTDPRITPFGRFLRRYSLDELPQLFNVLSGSMSLVGPRPPLPAEVALYGDDVRRRLLVKPGLTGLWQVSGRSNLSWADSVQLDLRYIEDWSLSLDLTVLWKTIRAVIRSDGAY